MTLIEAEPINKLIPREYLARYLQTSHHLSLLIGFSRLMGIGVQNKVELVTTSFTEFFTLTGDVDLYQPSW